MSWEARSLVHHTFRVIVLACALLGAGLCLLALLGGLPWGRIYQHLSLPLLLGMALLGGSAVVTMAVGLLSMLAEEVASTQSAWEWYRSAK